MCMQNKVQSKSGNLGSRNSRWSGLAPSGVYILCVGSLKRPKHAVHDEGLGTALMTRFKFVMHNVIQHECLLHI